MESLNIRAITWNVEGTDKPSDFECQQLLGVDPQNVDIYIIGFQEIRCRADNVFLDIVYNGEDPWTKALKEELVALNFVKVTSKRYFGTVITLFCLRNHLRHLRNIDSQYLSLARDLDWYGKNMVSDLVGRKIGSWPRALKGAVSIRFELYSKAYCFVCTHLEAHDYNLDVRIRQYNQVVEDLEYKSRLQSKIFDHDYVVWMGDLNFRLEGPDLNFDQIVSDIYSGNLTKLLKFDQLKKVQKNETAFGVFLEDGGIPSFPPSYKFKIGTNIHDRKRSPAWTDRILFYSSAKMQENLDPNNITTSSYVSYHGDNFFCSDHRPVSCDFSCNVKPFSVQNKMLLTAGVRFFPNNTKPVWHVTDDNIKRYPIKTLTISYEIMEGSDSFVDSWDWIGLYKHSFSSINDYCSFTWASNYPKNSSIRKCSIRGACFEQQCRYILLYISADFSIFGLSDSFEME